MYSRILTELVVGNLGSVERTLGTSGLESTLIQLSSRTNALFKSYIMPRLRYKIRKMRLKARF